MNKREAQRKLRIQEVLNTLKAAKDSVVDFKKLRYMLMYEYGCSGRTAKEYIDVAKSQI